MRQVGVTVIPGGVAIISTFAIGGPEACSGLPISQYSPTTLAEAFGGHFELVETGTHDHLTPWGTAQSFVTVVLRRLDAALGHPPQS